MKDLVNFLLDKIGDKYYYTTEDASVNELEAKADFCKLSGYVEGDENFSEEIFDDCIIFTHMTGNDTVYIYVTNLDGSEHIVVSKSPLADIEMITGHGINLFLCDTEMDKEKYPDGMNYLAWSILFHEIADGTKRDLIAIETKKFFEKYNEHPGGIYLIDENKFLITMHESNLYIIDKECNIIENVMDKVNNIIDPIAEDEVMTVKVKNSRYLVIEIRDINNDFQLDDKLKRSYVYDIESDLIVNKFEGKIHVGKIYYTGDTSTSFMMITENKMRFTPEIEKEIKENESPELFEAIFNLQKTNFVSGLVPLVLLDPEDMNKYFQINYSIDDIGDEVYGMNMVYTVYSVDGDRFGFRFYSCKDHRIVYEDVVSNEMPQTIMCNPRTGLVHFKLSSSSFLHLLVFYKEIDEIYRYSNFTFKSRGKQYDSEDINRLYTHFYNTSISETIAKDEHDALADLVYEYYETEGTGADGKFTIGHYSNLATDDILQDYKLAINQEGRFMSKIEEFTNRYQLMYRRTHKQSLKDYLEEVRVKDKKKEEQFKKDLEEIEKGGNPLGSIL